MTGGRSCRRSWCSRRHRRFRRRRQTHASSTGWCAPRRGPSGRHAGLPRYGQSVTADPPTEVLHGEHGDLAASITRWAVLFASTGPSQAASVSCAPGTTSSYWTAGVQRGLQRRPPHQDADGDGRVVGELEHDGWGRSRTIQILLGVPAALAGERTDVGPTRRLTARDAYGARRRSATSHRAVYAAQPSVTGTGGGRWPVSAGLRSNRTGWRQRCSA